MNMKRLTTLLLAMVVLMGAYTLNAQDKNKAKIEVTEHTHDFGTIKEADGPVTHVFEVKNTGDAPLVITRVMSSCGCTTPTFNREPIAPGKTGKITVVYNPAGRVYPFVKTVSVYSNGKEGPFILTIKGTVVKE